MKTHKVTKTAFKNAALIQIKMGFWSSAIADAKKLHSVLNDLFGAKVEYRDWGWGWRPTVTFTGSAIESTVTAPLTGSGTIVCNTASLAIE